MRCLAALFAPLHWNHCAAQCFAIPYASLQLAMVIFVMCHSSVTLSKTPRIASMLLLYLSAPRSTKQWLCARKLETRAVFSNILLRCLEVSQSGPANSASHAPLCLSLSRFARCRSCRSSQAITSWYANTAQPLLKASSDALTSSSLGFQDLVVSAKLTGKALLAIACR